jgi:hypothetical protein
MARRRYQTRTVATPKRRVPPKRWQVFESVITNQRGQPRLHDRARVKLTGRSAMSRVPGERGYEYTGRGYLGSGPWRPTLHPRGADGRFVKK